MSPAPSIEKEAGELRVKSVKFEWSIEKFSEHVRNKIVCSIKSPTFYNNLCLRVFPIGIVDGSKDFVSVYLVNESQSSCKVTCDISIVNDAGERKKTLGFRDHTLTRMDNDWGWACFIERSLIMDPFNRLLVDDTLTILCEISADQDYVLRQENQLESFDKLLNRKDFSDVTFILDGRKLYAHRNVLAVRSSTFESMFLRDLKQNEFDIDDVPYDTFLELLRYIYGGKVQNIKQIGQDLLTAADRYRINDLKVKCEQVLCDKVNVDNALEYLVLADRCNSPAVKNYVMEFLKKHTKEVISMRKFTDLAASSPKLAAEVTCWIMNSM